MLMVNQKRLRELDIRIAVRKMVHLICILYTSMQTVNCAQQHVKCINEYRYIQDYN